MDRRYALVAAEMKDRTAVRWEARHDMEVPDPPPLPSSPSVNDLIRINALKFYPFDGDAATEAAASHANLTLFSST